MNIVQLIAAYPYPVFEMSEATTPESPTLRSSMVPKISSPLAISSKDIQAADGCALCAAVVQVRKLPSNESERPRFLWSFAEAKRNVRFSTCKRVVETIEADEEWNERSTVDYEDYKTYLSSDQQRHWAPSVDYEPLERGEYFTVWFRIAEVHEASRASLDDEFSVPV